MKIKIWGARGSLPSPHTPVALENRFRKLLTQFVESKHSGQANIDAFLSTLPQHARGGFGGNTTCIEVTSKKQQIIVDAGSGIRLLGYDLLKGPCGSGKGELHILLSHFHWDHLVGLPFFVPIFIPGNVLHFYAVQSTLTEAFEVVFKKPYFPVNLKDLGSKIIYHQIEARKPLQLGDIEVTPYQLDHPDPCYGFKFIHEGHSYSHCFDTECSRFTREEMGPDLPLYQNTDLMLFDAQYTLIESIEKVNWGHASSTIGIDLAFRENIKKILFVHHDPASSDEKIAQVEAQTKRYYEAQRKNMARNMEKVPELDWCFAYEGMTFDV